MAQQPQAVYATDEVCRNSTGVVLLLMVFLVWTTVHYRSGTSKEDKVAWY
jgi:hypothetical protein